MTPRILRLQREALSRELAALFCYRGVLPGPECRPGIDAVMPVFNRQGDVIG